MESKYTPVGSWIQLQSKLRNDKGKPIGVVYYTFWKDVKKVVCIMHSKQIIQNNNLYMRISTISCVSEQNCWFSGSIIECHHKI